MTPRERLYAYDHIAEFVRDKLRSRSLQQVAIRAGVDRTTIMRVARGRPVYLATARSIIDGFAR